MSAISKTFQTIGKKFFLIKKPQFAILNNLQTISNESFDEGMNYLKVSPHKFYNCTKIREKSVHETLALNVGKPLCFIQ